MAQDEIIREVRAIREAYAERFGFDIRALYNDAKEREGKGNRQVVALEPKLVKPAAEAEDAGRDQKGRPASDPLGR
ncbi:MAG TPA: hypothetical protein VGG03_11860 [Thermoanaerobaculia bacterium]|jgi:hypothetical protein